jgi:hypothetical protein
VEIFERGDDWTSEQRLAARSNFAESGFPAEPAREVDPYCDIRHALRPEHAELPERELAALLGRLPMLVVLHQMLTSPWPQQVSLAALLGPAGRQRFRLNGADVSVSAYLRLLSRLFREAAQYADNLTQGESSDAVNFCGRDFPTRSSPQVKKERATGAAAMSDELRSVIDQRRAIRPAQADGDVPLTAIPPVDTTEGLATDVRDADETWPAEGFDYMEPGQEEPL